MKTRTEVSAEKLRGGFYTPPQLVAHAVERLAELLRDKHDLRILEPSIGDGAFVDGLEASRLSIESLTGVEVLATEAAKASERISRARFDGRVVTASALAWSLQNGTRDFDAVVGNLPFVRFQFVSEQDRDDAARLATELEVSIGGVSNLWLPMLLASLRQIRRGGAFVLVLPAECLTGVSAGSAREWMLRHVDELRCDLYPAGSFPGALQEVVLLSGRLRANSQEVGELTVALHSRLHSDAAFSNDAAIVTTHRIAGGSSWTRRLLAPTHLEALEEFESLEAVTALGNLAKFEVATVTGANAFFSLSAKQVDEYELGQWVRPLLPRSRYAPGLVFTSTDFDKARREGVSTFIFDAALSPADREKHAGLDRYLKLGEAQDLHLRYKCRIREPWWAVPGIRVGELLLSKRCHRFPRMIANTTDATTTDTIYRGRAMQPRVSAPGIAAAFHNSGTLLTAELEGRNFGGGVLELVPSEVSRLQVPIAPNMAEEVDRLDRVSRETAGKEDEVLRWETDLLLSKAEIGLTAPMLETLSEARDLLLSRRLARSSVARN